MKKLFDELPKARQARIKEQANKELVAYESLQELRKAIGMTQTDVAEAQGIKQVNISNLENRKDMHLSTLKKYIEALGCELEIFIKKPDNVVVRIDHIFGL